MKTAGEDQRELKEASTTKVVVQMTDEEKQSWKETAKEQGMTLSDWIRQLVQPSPSRINKKPAIPAGFFMSVRFAGVIVSFPAT